MGLAYPPIIKTALVSTRCENVPKSLAGSLQLANQQKGHK
jgi:hypothetical protein